MQEITLAGEAKISSPNPVTIVCTQKPDGSTNLAAVSWWTYLSYNPNMIAYAMAKTSYSGEMVRQNKKVILTIPSDKIADVVMECGSSTGRNTDKITKFSVKMKVLPDCNISVPEYSALAIVCKLKEYIETGDHYLYICNVEKVYADEQEKAVFAWNGYSRIRAVR